MEWYRAYHGLPSDPKLQVVAKRTGQPMAVVVAVWVCVLDAASQHKLRGVIDLDAEEVAVIQGIEMEDAEAILQAFYDKDMVDDYNRLTAWDKRQHSTSAERVKKHREAKKRDVTPCNTKKRSVTKGNTKKREKHKNTTDTDTDTDKEQIQSKTDSKQTRTEKKQNRKKTEKEEKGECEREKPTSCGQEDKTHIFGKMLDIWNEEVQSKLTPQHKAKLTPKRKELIAHRWLEDFEQSMDAWRYYCEVIGASDFCLGKIDGKDWSIDLTWAVESSEHVAKILEGAFSGGKHPAKPTVCDVPELQDAWDFVIDHLEQRFSKIAIRSWFGNTIITEIVSVADGSIVKLQCPRAFIRDLIESRFLPEINHAFHEQPHYHIPIITTELTVKE